MDIETAIAYWEIHATSKDEKERSRRLSAFVHSGRKVRSHKKEPDISKDM